MKKLEIQKARNGYIITNSFIGNGAKVFRNLEEVFEELKNEFEPEKLPYVEELIKKMENQKAYDLAILKEQQK